MALPTRDQLNAEVDRRFFEQHPDAPARLDPNDPNQTAWVNAWLAIRDDVLNAWTNTVFFSFFPAAGQLDPNNPGDATLIEYWTDIRDQIRDGVPGRYSWAGDPAASQQGAQLVSVERDPAGGWVVTFDRPVSVDQVIPWLWAGGLPAGVQVVNDTPQKIHLHNLSIEAVQGMNAQVANQITPTVITAPAAGSAGAASSSTSTDPASIDVEIDETTRAKIGEWTEGILHGGHALASTTEVTESLALAVSNITGPAGRAAALAKAAGVVAEWTGPVGDVFLVIWVGYQVVDSFMAEKRYEKQQGFVYGVMWQALNEPDHLPAFVDGITYSADEHRAAFQAGVAEGRAKAQDPTVRNQIILAVATLGLSTGYGDFYAANEVLSQLWRARRERAPGDQETDTIRWPVPYDRGFF